MNDAQTRKATETMSAELQADPVTVPDHTAIEAAAARIAGWVRRTPLLEVQAPSGGTLELKLECLQVSGTFKARGAFSRLIRARERAMTLGETPPDSVVAASGGNHGIAVALAARHLGWKAEIFVPRTAPQAKQARLRALGARVHAVGEEYAEALAAAQEFVARTGALSSHAYDQYDTLAGQGTVAREWLQQGEPATRWLVAVGGGGLIGGMAAWLEACALRQAQQTPQGESPPRLPRLPQLIAVESQGCPTLHSALQAGEPLDIQPQGLAADALGARRVGAGVFALRHRIANSVLVSDEDIAAAQVWLWQQARIATEPGGATALAAVLGGQVPLKSGERIGVLVCGANVDPAALADRLAEYQK
ncbi:MAG: pyridoxal-phosphate dependent enzyme [Burkholderiaceae bacterium]